MNPHSLQRRKQSEHVEFMYEQGMAHDDLVKYNIMMDASPEGWHPAIIDFEQDGKTLLPAAT